MKVIQLVLVFISLGVAIFTIRIARESKKIVDEMARKLKEYL